jgi:hypothetical protein
MGFRHLSQVTGLEGELAHRMVFLLVPACENPEASQKDERG